MQTLADDTEAGAFGPKARDTKIKNLIAYLFSMDIISVGTPSFPSAKLLLQCLLLYEYYSLSNQPKIADISMYSSGVLWQIVLESTLDMLPECSDLTFSRIWSKSRGTWVFKKKQLRSKGLNNL